MKQFFPAVTLLFFIATSAHAWGRHDLITQVALDSPEFSYLKTVNVAPESIEHAAPDLLRRVIPELEVWCESYHREHDSRYDWKAPAMSLALTDRAALLWALEDNMDTELPTGKEITAADILVAYVDEPDGALDGGLNQSPYAERLRPSMSLFAGDDTHTHAFRHYYVPTSLVPPILEPKGIAPYRAALYARLSEGAFHTGHPYWGYRFLAWSMHYVQDVTQPWHTVFLPGPQFLKFSKAEMKHEISSLHYLSEAFADAWMERTVPDRSLGASPIRVLASASAPVANPWFIAELAETLAREAHDKISQVADLARQVFSPIVDQLDSNLKPKWPWIALGGVRFPSEKLDFSGNGAGATQFLAPMWSVDFSLAKARDLLTQALVQQINSAIEGSRILAAHVLELKPHVSLLNEALVSAPT